MMTIICDECQREIHEKPVMLHTKCLFELQMAVNMLEARIEELEEQLGGGTLFSDETQNPQ
jgi:hypothetical protein